MRLFLVFLLYWFSCLVVAQALPSTEWIEQALNQPAEQSDLTEAQRSELKQLLDLLQQHRQVAQDIQALNQTLADLPRQRQILVNALQAVADTALVNPDQTNSPEALAQSLSTLNEDIARWRNQLQQLTVDLSQLSTGQQDMLGGIAELERQLNLMEANEPAPTSEQAKWLKLAEQQLLVEQLAYQRLLYDSADERGELLRLEQELLQQRLLRAAPIVADLQLQLARQRQESNRQLIDQALQLSQILETSAPLLQEQTALNDSLALELQRLLERQSQLQRKQVRLDSQRQQLAAALSEIRANIDWLKKSTKFGASLRAQLQGLPRELPQTDLADKIADAHVRMYELGQWRNRLTPSPPEAPQQLTEPEQQTFTALLVLQRQLLLQLDQEYGRLISAMTGLQAVHSQLARELAVERRFLREQQLWIRSMLPLWGIQPSPDPQLWLGNPAPADTLTQLLKRLGQHLPELLVLLTAGTGLLLIRYRLQPRLTARQQRYRRHLNQPKKDKFHHSLVLLLLLALDALLLPTWFYLVGLWLGGIWPPNSLSDYNILLLTTAAIIFLFRFVCQLCVPQGVLEAHLGWPAGFVAWLRQRVHVSRWPILVLLLVLGLNELLTLGDEAELSRFLFLGLVGWLLHFYWTLFHATRLPSVLPRAIRQGISLQVLRLIALLPLAAVFVLACLGVFMAAWTLLLYHQLTLMTLVGYLLIYQLSKRWLQLEQRELSYQRAVARRQEQQAKQATEEGKLVEPLPEIDEAHIPVTEVSEQSMTLLRGLMLLALVMTILALWSGALRQIGWMEQVVIWQVSAQGEAGTVLQNITLRSLLIALIVTGVALFAASKLPGVLELLVLRRLTLSPGTGYAITTTLRYVFLVFGVLYAFNILGFQWSKLQWLVAAFSVGLGFGLQEIFANFVSGLILLYEKPIRIGDVVTINDLTGTISRINTRATTIVDLDRKEIVVPNKAFITGQLINWSLSDVTLRLVLPIGVAYGSDIALVERLLYQVAEVEDTVLDDPPPQVLFLNFGANSLEFELRVFITHIAQRHYARHQLNVEIDRLFREHDVVIAFPQLDLHVKETPPQPPTA